MSEKTSLRAMMTRLLALTVLVATFAASGCGKSPETSPEESAAKPAEPAYLLVQSSRGFEYDGNRLTVHGTSPTTIFFSDRPDRIAGHMSLEEAYSWGHSGDDSFVVDPPNATLSILEAGEMANVVVTMSSGVVAGDSIAFDVAVLEGDLPSQGGPNTLFIDVIGRPLSPASVGGVRRRTRRRTRRSMAVGAEVGASAGEASAAQSQQAAEEAQASADQAAASNATDATAAPSVEQQLSDLKDMLDKGLITQQDYDTKKQQLLDSM